MKVHIRPDPFNKKTWYTNDVPDLCAYLAQEFKVFPTNARIYHNDVALKNDVTPTDERSIKNLQSLDGEFYIVVYPAFIQFIFYAIVAITAALSIYTYMTMPKPQVSAPQSANNDLASRQNQPRINGRIPDIFGQLRSTPDLIAPPFTYYNENLIEIEECLMVIGRGYYQIGDCREDQTSVTDIADSSVSVYDPNTSITGAAIYQVGSAFTQPPLYVIKSKSINGQTLEMPNDIKVESTAIYFEAPDLIKSRGGLNFTSLFAANDTVAVYGADFGVSDVPLFGQVLFKSSQRVVVETATKIDSVNSFGGVLLIGALVEIITEVPPDVVGDPPTYVTTYKDLSGQYKVTGINETTISGGYNYEITLTNAMQVNPSWQFITTDKTAGAGVQLNKNESAINLNGSYQIDSITASEIKLKNPDQVNTDWDKLLMLPAQSTVDQVKSIRLDKIDSKWVGWHNLAMPECEQLVFNIFFPNGLFYQDSKGGVYSESMTVLIEYQRINSLGQPIGLVTQTYKTISTQRKAAFGTTVKLDLSVVGPVRFRIARTTPTKNDKTQDMAKIKDAYAAAKSSLLNYGDCTVVRSKTVGTEGALSLKERKLNFLVTRKLPLDGTGAMTATKSAAQALISLALDDKIGRRSQLDLDINQIKTEIAEVNAYFGSTKASEFSYTIDDANLSFEEIAGMVASSCFCEPTRFGSKLRINFDKPKSIPSLLFNHRNKAPKTEKRTHSFGVNKDYDGVEIEYISSIDDARVTYIAPEGGAKNNLMKISTTGIRTEEQAKTRAWREWNKLYYQRVAVEFEGLDESNLLSRNDAILVADNTATKTQDGEVQSVDGLTLYLSQNVTISAGSSIYLQMPDGTVDMIGCTAGPLKNQVVLARAPLFPLIVDNDRYLKTVYEIVGAGSESSSLFVLTEMSPQSKMTNSLKCVNYDARYYEKDHVFF